MTVILGGEPRDPVGHDHPPHESDTPLKPTDRNTSDLQS